MHWQLHGAESGHVLPHLVDLRHYRTWFSIWLPKTTYYFCAGEAIWSN